MTQNTDQDTKSIIVERLMKQPSEKVWRALTVAELVGEWLMSNDFTPAVGHRFQLRSKPMPGWSGVTNCEVLEVEEPRRLVYSWGDGTESTSGLKSIVTWTLTPTDGGTHVRMEQSGFKPADGTAYDRMGRGWVRILENLERIAAGDTGR